MEVIRAESPGILMLASGFYIGCGIVMGTIIMKTVVSKSAHFRFGIIAATSFGNWADLTNAVILSLGEMPPFKVNDSAVGIAYTSMFCIIPTILTFSLAQSWLTRDFADAPVEIPSNRRKKRYRFDIMSTFSLDLEHADNTTTTTENAPKETSAWQQFKSCSWISRRRVQFVRRLVWSIFTPPNIAMFLAIVIGSIPELKGLFISNNKSIPMTDRTRAAPLGFIFETADFIGNACVPLGVMIIGGAFMRLVQLLRKNNKTRKQAAAHDEVVRPELSSDVPEISPEKEAASAPQEQPSSSTLPASTIKISFFIGVARLLIMPILGYLFWDLLLCQMAGVIKPEDKMLRFVLLFQGIVPTAQTQILLSQMTDPRGLGLDMSYTGLTQYIASMVTVTGWLIAIFWILFST